MFMKICLNNQIHLYNGEMSLFSIKSHCRNVFKGLPKSYEFVYLDEDNDEITINSQADINMLKQINSNKPAKLYIKQYSDQFQILSDDSLKIEDNENQFLIIKQQKQREEQIIIKQAIKSYLLEAQNKLIKKLVDEEQRVIESQVDLYMGKLIEETAIKIVSDEEKEKKQSYEKVSIGIQNNEKMSMETIEKLVNEKVEQIIPEIIRRTTKLVSNSIKAQNKQCHCKHQENKDSDLEFERLINKQLRNKYRRRSQNKECYF